MRLRKPYYSLYYNPRIIIKQMMRQYEPHINQMFILLFIHLCDLIFGSM